MTEKQYSLIYHGDNGGAFIKDNEKGIEWYHDSCASLLEIVDKLNELSDENKELKQRIERLENYKEASIKFTKEVEDFFERHEIDTVNFDILDIVFDNFDFYADQYDELKKQNKELQRENEQLKQEIDTLQEQIAHFDIGDVE